jgi:hypothetical protein
LQRHGLLNFSGTSEQGKSYQQSFWTLTKSSLWNTSMLCDLSSDLVRQTGESPLSTEYIFSKADLRQHL